MIRLASAPAPGLALALGVAGTALAGALLLHYARAGRLRPAARAVLLGCRLATLAAAILLALSPVRVLTRREVLGAPVAVLLDESASAAERDPWPPGEDRDAWARALAAAGAPAPPPEGRSRLDLAKALLAPARPEALKLLSEGGRSVAVYAFSAAARRLGDTGQEPISGIADRIRDAKADGAATDVAGAVLGILREYRGRPLAGIVVLSDGRSTSGIDAEEAAAEARAREVPITAVLLGCAAGGRNIRVRDASAPERAFEGDEVSIEAEVANEGFAGRRADVRVLEDERTIAREAVALEEGRPSRFRARIVPAGPGPHRYRIRAIPDPAERTAEDNEASVRVEVVREKTALLLVASEPAWEYRFLRNHWLRDKSILVSCVLTSAPEDFPPEGTKPIPSVPADLAALQAYDVVVLIDPDPARLPAPFLEALPAFVGERGGGLLFVAGTKHAGEALARPALGRILPIEPKPASVRAAGRPEPKARELKLRPSPGPLHPILRVGPGDEATVAFWSAAPGPYEPIEVERVKPGAEVVLTAGDGTPWLVVEPYGAGRSAFLASAETWRIRRAGEEPFHRFWGQAVRYLRQGRLLGSRERISLAAGRPAVAVGERQFLRARALRPDFTPFAPDAPLEAVVRAAGREVARVRLDGIEPGEFEGAFVAVEAGPHEAVLAVGEARAVAAFEVRLPRPESEDVRPDREALERLALGSGGRLVAPDKLLDACREIAAKRTEIPTEEEISLLAGREWPVFAAFLLVLALEWAWRRLRGLP